MMNFTITPPPIEQAVQQRLSSVPDKVNIEPEHIIQLSIELHVARSDRSVRAKLDSMLYLVRRIRRTEFQIAFTLSGVAVLPIVGLPLPTTTGCEHIRVNKLKLLMLLLRSPMLDFHRISGGIDACHTVAAKSTLFPYE